MMLALSGEKGKQIELHLASFRKIRALVCDSTWEHLCVGVRKESSQSSRCTTITIIA